MKILMKKGRRPNNDGKTVDERCSFAVQCDKCNMVTWVWGDSKTVRCKTCGKKEELNKITGE